jgi:hypothetical protein
MPPPQGLEYCKTRLEALQAIQGDCLDHCIEWFTCRMEEERTSSPDQAKIIQAFPYQKIEIFATFFVMMMFYSDRHIIHNISREHARRINPELHDQDIK